LYDKVSARIGDSKRADCSVSVINTTDHNMKCNFWILSTLVDTIEEAMFNTIKSHRFVSNDCFHEEILFSYVKCISFGSAEKELFAFTGLGITINEIHIAIAVLNLGHSRTTISD
jgi:hypothetical protein